MSEVVQKVCQPKAPMSALGNNTTLNRPSTTKMRGCYQMEDFRYCNDIHGMLKSQAVKMKELVVDCLGCCNVEEDSCW